MRPEHDSRVTYATLNVPLGQSSYQLSYFDRPGNAQTIVYIHGLGCSKSDFLGMTLEPRLDSFRLLSFDHPSCGDTPYDPGNQLCIDDLVEEAERFTDALGLNKFLLVGHSMGGLAALLFAGRNPSKITGFVNAEGNLAPEDCFFSRLVAGGDYASFESQVFPALKRELSGRQGLGFRRHSEVMAGANPRAYYDYCLQIVEYSDRGNLLDRFLTLPVSACFVYGSQNAHLSYLPSLRKSECKVIEIPAANHFPFHDNPHAFAEALSVFAGGQLLS